jgi:phosphoenolpyruvate carboxykinase (ATP)
VNSDAAVLLNMDEGVIVIAGTAYAGEMKKSVFTAMNYYLPLEGVLSLHSAANVDPKTGKTALFFGLSGTGKTTLSTDTERILIGDDEHGWTEEGIFNIEGGCYAKVIRLSAEAEPAIFEQTHEFGTILENVIFEEDSRELDLDDDSITENTRGSYPLESLRHVYDQEVAPHPTHVILLTADAFGVMPPVARLSNAQALYHFLSGYTSKLAGTEQGVTEPQRTFSSCYGAPFMALNPTVYAELLEERLRATGAKVWLVNTGWTGGPYGVGHRISIQETRKMVRAVLNDGLDRVLFRKDPVFGFEVPETCPGVNDGLLDPRSQWSDTDEYDRTYKQLADGFRENFEQFRRIVSPEVANAGP